MATPYDLDGLRLAIRERIGYDSTTVIGDTELTKMINDVVHDVWDILVQSDAVATDGPRTTNTVAGTREYLVGDGTLPFVYRIKRVALQFDGYSYPLETFEFSDAILGTAGRAWGPGCLPRYRTKYGQASNISVSAIIFDHPPDAVYTVEYWYNPAPPSLSSGTHIPFALRFPVDEYIILECSIRCKRRLRLDAAELMVDRDRYLQRIEQYYQPEQRERAPMALRTKPLGFSRGRRWH